MTFALSKCEKHKFDNILSYLSHHIDLKIHKDQIEKKENIKELNKCYDPLFSSQKF